MASKQWTTPWRAFTWRFRALKQKQYHLWLKWLLLNSSQSSSSHMLNLITCTAVNTEYTVLIYYISYIPEFFWDRQRSFVQHSLKSLEAASCCTSQQVQEQSKGLYKVQSEQSCERYSVDLWNNDRFESDLLIPIFYPASIFFFFLLFSNTLTAHGTQYSLCPDYTSSPYVTLDSDVVSSQKHLEVKEVIDQDTTVCTESFVGSVSTCKDNSVHPVAIDCCDIQCLKTDMEANEVSTAVCPLREIKNSPGSIIHMDTHGSWVVM